MGQGTDGSFQLGGSWRFSTTIAMFAPPPSSDLGRITATAVQWDQPQSFDLPIVSSTTRSSLSSTRLLGTSVAPVGRVALWGEECFRCRYQPLHSCRRRHPPFATSLRAAACNRTTTTQESCPFLGGSEGVPPFDRLFSLSKFPTASKTKPLNDDRVTHATKRTIKLSLFKPVRSAIGR